MAVMADMDKITVGCLLSFDSAQIHILSSLILAVLFPNQSLKFCKDVIIRFLEKI